MQAGRLLVEIVAVAEWLSVSGYVLLAVVLQTQSLAVLQRVHAL